MQSTLWSLQFIFDLPQRLRKCMNAEDYSTAVKYYKGALPILQVMHLLGLSYQQGILSSEQW